MNKHPKFYKRDLEDFIYHSIEEQNRIAGYPTGKPRYPELNREFGDINVIAFWKVINKNTRREKKSLYTDIHYTAWIDGIEGHLLSSLPSKCTTHSTNPY
jgi:hypothetical protein